MLNKILAEEVCVGTTWYNHKVKQGEFLRSFTSQCFKIYLTIKIHKDGNPCRPVVSFIDATTYKLSKMYSNILKNVVGNSSRTVKNSTRIRDKLSKIHQQKTISWNRWTLSRFLPIFQKNQLKRLWKKNGTK